MYVGHFAAGLALKAIQPRAPLSALLIGVGLADTLFGLFVLLGIERVSITPEVSPGFSLDFVDWSHSLVSGLVLGALFALPFLRRGWAVAAVCGFSVFTHFLLDFPFHPGDLALLPHSETHFGLGWWVSIPVGWWFLELVFVLAGWALYAWRGRQLGNFAQRPWAILAVLIFLQLSFSPWGQKLLL